MRLHKDTLKQLDKIDIAFQEDIKLSIKKIMKICQDNSPMADIVDLINDNSVVLENIILENRSSDWMPIRNILRLIAKLINISDNNKITELSVLSMSCSCDNFKGYMEVKYENGDIMSGEYKWQWTVFKDAKINFDKFIIFPKPTIIPTIQNQL